MKLRGVALAMAAATFGASFAACDGEFRFDDQPTDAPFTEIDGGDAEAATGDTACTSDERCAKLGLRCDTSRGRCVGCLTNAECGSAMAPRCDPVQHVCVRCLTTSDCSSRETCDMTTRRCVGACADHAEYCAANGFVCDEVAGRCIECRTNAHCAGSPRGPLCDQVIGTCVECSSNASCPSDKPRCDRRTGKCAPCVTSYQCPEGSACDPTSLTCVSVP